MTAAGRDRAAIYTWSITAQKTVEAYELALTCA